MLSSLEEHRPGCSATILARFHMTNAINLINDLLNFIINENLLYCRFHIISRYFLQTCF